MSGRTLLGVGRFEPWEKERIADLLREVELEFEVCSTSKEVTERLERSTPTALLLEAEHELGRLACLAARAHAEHAHMPSLCLSREMGDLAFAEAFSWGADDVIDRREPEALLPRLRQLPRNVPPAPHGERGRAVVAEPDKDRRVVVGRALINAGYEVKFALSASDALAYAVGARLVIFNLALGDELERWLEETKDTGSHWLFTTTPREVSRYARRIAENPRANVTDGFAPPENLVFLGNELGTRGADKRSSARLLYGTMVNFRGAGRDKDDHGFSYNIGREGIYVRTLAPVAHDRVWLELRPPRTDRFVRLEGQVMWRRPFDLRGGATVPPGFGVKIVEATPTCGGLWQSGYTAFSPVRTPSGRP